MTRQERYSVHRLSTVQNAQDADPSMYECAVPCGTDAMQHSPRAEFPLPVPVAGLTGRAHIQLNSSVCALATVPDHPFYEELNVEPQAGLARSLQPPCRDT